MGLESPRVLRALGSQTAQDFPLDLSKSKLQVVVLVLGVRQDWVQEQRKVEVPIACAGERWSEGEVLDSPDDWSHSVHLHFLLGTAF